MDQLLPVEAGREQLLVGTNLRAGLQTREGFTKLLEKLRTNLLHHLQLKLCFFHEKLSPKYFRGSQSSTTLDLALCCAIYVGLLSNTGQTAVVTSI